MRYALQWSLCPSKPCMQKKNYIKNSGSWLFLHFDQFEGLFCSTWSPLLSLLTTEFLDASTHLYKRVCPSVHWSVRRSVTHFISHSKNSGKWSKMTFHTSTGFLIRSVTLNLSFHIPHNLSFTILLSKSSFKIFFSPSLLQ